MPGSSRCFLSPFETIYPFWISTYDLNYHKTTSALKFFKTISVLYDFLLLGTGYLPNL